MFMYCLFNYVFFCKRNTIKAAYQNLQLIKCSTYMKLEHLQPFVFILKTTKNLNLMSSNINLRGEKGTSRTSPKNKIKLKIKIKVGKKSFNREDQQKPKVVSLKRPIRRLLWRSHRLCLYSMSRLMYSCTPNRGGRCSTTGEELRWHMLCSLKLRTRAKTKQKN